MRKINILLLLLLTTFIVTNASAEVIVSEFYQIGCSHCVAVEESGILERVDRIEGVTVNKYDIRIPGDYLKYEDFHKKIDMQEGTPLVVVECENGELLHLIGDKPIINGLEKAVTDCTVSQQSTSFFGKIKEFCETCFENDITTKGRLGFWGFLALILAAIVDSINPCAFGVLLFLMLALLNLGSQKRALKGGLIYTLMVFITYFLAGLGLFAVIQQVSSVRDYIYTIVGILVLILSLIEFRDYLVSKKGKESILKIPKAVKPIIEKYSKKGTIIAILILGIAVSIFELPCTGGIYLAIISLLSQTPEWAIVYLLIYNIIFVLPLLIMTILIYKGMSPETLQKWTNKERGWMKLGAALVMLAFAIYLLYSPIMTFFS